MSLFKISGPSINSTSWSVVYNQKTETAIVTIVDRDNETHKKTINKLEYDYIVGELGLNPMYEHFSGCDHTINPGNLAYLKSLTGAEQ